KTLCDKEGYKISSKGANIIAAEADGSIRDSLSLTDRILSAASANEIDDNSILENLGLIDMSLLFEVSNATINSDGAKLIEIIDKVNDSGLDLKKFYSNLIKHFRNLVVVKICGENSDSIDISDYERNQLKQTVENVTKSYLTWLLNSLLNEETMIKFSSHTKTAVEMALLKLLQIREGVDIDKIISKLDLLNTRPGTISGTIKDEKKEDNIPSDTPASTVIHEEPKSINESMATFSEPEHIPEPAKEKTFEEFLKLIEGRYPFIAATLKKGCLKSISDQGVHIELDSCTPFEMTRYENKKNDINKLSNNYFGSDIRLTILSEPDLKKEEQKEKSFSQKKQEAMDHPHIANTMRIFNGTLVDIK
ncbi:MAG: hypothetical protein GY707_10520, partial [Desulfobacteraceae bacterium]|nr:hypothetical protein [Desulfobacteraceae bacterium]